VDGGDDGVWAEEGDHVGAVGDNDLPAAGGKIFLADLKIRDPDFLEIVHLLERDTFGEILCILRLAGGEDEEGAIAEIAGGANLLGAALEILQFGSGGIDELGLQFEIVELIDEVFADAGVGDVVGGHDSSDAEEDQRREEFFLGIELFGHGFHGGFEGGREVIVLVFVGGIDEDEAGDVCGVLRGEDANVEATEGMGDEDVGRLFARGGEERVKFPGDFVAGAREGAGGAPAIAGAIVRADAREFGDVRLDEIPAGGGNAEARIQDYGGRAGAGAIEIERDTGKFGAERDGAAFLGIAAGIAGVEDGLIDDAEDGGGNDKKENADEEAFHDAPEAGRFLGRRGFHESS
jgi:hypothetical protein